jgi:Acyltransferase family
MTTHNQPVQRDTNLDILKSICISFVLLWHFQPLQPVLDIHNAFNDLTQALGKIINYQVFLMAVPLFFIISLHLFLKKENSTSAYLSKRIQSLLKLVVFWTSFQFIFYGITLWIGVPDRNGTVQQFSLSSLESMAKLLIGIAPSLPFVGDSVFYFLINLIIITTLTSLYARISSSIRAKIAMPLIAVSVIYFEALALLNLKTPYCFPDSFLTYIVVADMFTHQRCKLSQFKYIYLFLYIGFSIQDVILRTSDDILSIYARASILFGCLTVLTFIYPAKMATPKLVKHLSKYSLGIFAIHKYSQYIFYVIFHPVSSTMNLRIVELPILPILVSTLALALTGYVIYLLRGTPLKQFIC